MRALLLIAVTGLAFAQPTAPDWRMGLASFYADRYHGRVTANGETFDMYALTAAAIKGVDLGAVLRVCRGDACVTVRINDRIPSRHGRTLDLSREAAARLGMLSQGVAVVRFQEAD